MRCLTLLLVINSDNNNNNNNKYWRYRIFIRCAFRSAPLITFSLSYIQNYHLASLPKMMNHSNIIQCYLWSETRWVVNWKQQCFLVSIRTRKAVINNKIHPRLGSVANQGHGAAEMWKQNYQGGWNKITNTMLLHNADFSETCRVFFISNIKKYPAFPCQPFKCI